MNEIQKPVAGDSGHATAHIPSLICVPGQIAVARSRPLVEMIRMMAIYTQAHLNYHQKMSIGDYISYIKGTIATHQDL